MEKRCVQLEEVDKDSSGLWGGESQAPPKETSVERETPPSSDTPHVVEIPPSNSSTTPPVVAVETLHQSVVRTEIQRAVVKP